MKALVATNITIAVVVNQSNLCVKRDASAGITTAEVDALTDVSRTVGKQEKKRACTSQALFHCQSFDKKIAKV